MIKNLIAKLWIIYATACHASLCTTALDCLTVSCHCHHTALTTIYKHGMRSWRWGSLGLCEVLCLLLVVVVVAVVVVVVVVVL